MWQHRWNNSTDGGLKGTTVTWREREGLWGPCSLLLQILWPGSAPDWSECWRSREVKYQWLTDGWQQGSRSQQETCSWPPEPQEGDQAPSESSGEGVDEFLWHCISKSHSAPFVIQSNSYSPGSKRWAEFSLRVSVGPDAPWREAQCPHPICWP